MSYSPGPSLNAFDPKENPKAPKNLLNRLFLSSAEHYSAFLQLNICASQPLFCKKTSLPFSKFDSGLVNWLETQSPFKTGKHLLSIKSEVFCSIFKTRLLLVVWVKVFLVILSKLF